MLKFELRKWERFERWSAVKAFTNDEPLENIDQIILPGIYFNTIFSIYWWWPVGSECTRLNIEIIFSSHFYATLSSHVPQAIFGEMDFCKSPFNLKSIVRFLTSHETGFCKTLTGACRPGICWLTISLFY